MNLVARLRRSRENKEAQLLQAGRSAGKEWAETAAWDEGERLYAYCKSERWQWALADPQKMARLLARAVIQDGAQVSDSQISAWWERVLGFDYVSLTHSTTAMLGFVDGACSIWREAVARTRS
jgi:hypothetical protein